MRIDQKSVFFLLSLISGFLLTACGNGVPDASTLNIQQMIINVAKTMPSLLAMFSAAAYVIGLGLLFKGVYKLKEYGEMRTAMSSHTNLWSAIITLTTGSLLIYFITSYELGLQTLFGYSSPLAYTSGGSSTDDLISSVVLITQVIGVIAFIRGILLLNNVGGHSGQPGTIGKGITFIIGGLLAINIYGTWVVIVNTLTGA